MGIGSRIQKSAAKMNRDTTRCSMMVIPARGIASFGINRINSGITRHKSSLG